MPNKNFKIAVICGMLFFLLAGLYFAKHAGMKRPALSRYPNGRNFAFSVTDDPDSSTLQSVKEVYGLLHELGLYTTAAVWVKNPSDTTNLRDGNLLLYKGENCDNPDYVLLMRDLQEKGFEIAMHTVSGGHDLREDTIAGYEKFKKIFGHNPKINIMHSKNLENLYWGRNVFSNAFLKRLLGFYDKTKFCGEHEESPYFWGDICREKTKYVRMWGTSDINTLKFNPAMPYYDQKKPYVNHWFSFSEGHTGDVFVKLVSDKNIEKLVKERGACVAYTHFGSGFIGKKNDGSRGLRDDFKKQMTKISRQKDGWFVPVSDMLDWWLILKNIVLDVNKNALIVSNINGITVKGLTLLVEPNEKFYAADGTCYEANAEGEIIMADISAFNTIALFKNYDKLTAKGKFPGRWENLSLVYERVKILILTRIRALREKLF